MYGIIFYVNTCIKMIINDFLNSGQSNECILELKIAMLRLLRAGRFFNT